MKRKTSNPAKFERCVKAVKKRGGAANAYAVCTAAGTRKNKKKRKRKNPEGESVKAFESFHGRQPDEVVTVERKIHYHRHLAAAGKLEALIVIARDGDIVMLSKFKGALLCMNEKGTQLYIEGGDQKVDLKQFGVKTPHEKELLGELKQVEYFTTKDHLGSEGGEAIYQHKFSKPLPTVIYDVLNEQLEIAGGKYVILPEGIDQ
jgi:hypothetical protein